MRRQQAPRYSPALLPAGRVCPRKRRCLSPDTVLLLALQNPACVVITLIYDQVSVCVVARVKVGDYLGGDPQAPHHCRKDRKICGLWIPGLSALRLREIMHLAGRSCLGHWVGDTSSFPPHLPELLSLGLHTKVRQLVAQTSTARAKRGSSKCWVPLPQPAGWDSHASFGKTQQLDLPHFSPGHKSLSSNQTVEFFSLLC